MILCWLNKSHDVDEKVEYCTIVVPKWCCCSILRILITFSLWLLNTGICGFTAATSLFYRRRSYRCTLELKVANILQTRGKLKLGNEQRNSKHPGDNSLHYQFNMMCTVIYVLLLCDNLTHVFFQMKEFRYIEVRLYFVSLYTFILLAQENLKPGL